MQHQNFAGSPCLSYLAYSSFKTTSVGTYPLPVRIQIIFASYLPGFMTERNSKYAVYYKTA